MVTTATNRRFSPFFIEALYETAVRRGKLRRGDALLLIDEHAADLVGASKTDAGALKELRDMLQFARENPPNGWIIDHPDKIPGDRGFHRNAPSHCITIRPAHAHRSENTTPARATPSTNTATKTTHEEETTA